jgi:DNA-binding beta-propeller fold protein YncE
LASFLASTLLVAPPVRAAEVKQQTFTGSVDASGTKFLSHSIDVAGPGQITASLDWDDPAANLGLSLKDPSGVAVAKAFTTNKPETLSLEASVAGTYKLGVTASSGAAAYTLEVGYPAADSEPIVARGRYETSFGFNGPAGLYAYGMDHDPTDDSVLVGDYWNYRVKRFNADGSNPRIVTTVKPKGVLGGITAPYDVETDLFDLDVNGKASFWVADQGSSRIVQFSHNGAWLQTIGVGGGGSDAAHPGRSYPQGCGNGAMQIPTHIFADPVTGKLYVADPRCREVYIFSHGGDYLGRLDWAPWKSATGLTTPIPRGVAEGSDGKLFVVEHNSRSVAVFDKAGQYQWKFPRQDDMNDPRGLDVDKTNGLVYVVGAYHNKVFQFDIATRTLRTKWDTVNGSSGGAKFDSIRFPATDDKGNVWVGDTWGYRVWKFDKEATPLSWAQTAQPPPNGGYNQNNGVALDPVTGNLFVVDTFEQRVQRFDAGSSCVSASNCPAWMSQFGSREPAGTQSKGFGYPRALTFGDGYVWVGDNNNAVLALTPDGTFVHRFGSQGSAEGQFKGGVQGVRVDGGKIYTTDVGNCRLQVFDQAQSLKPGNTGGTLLAAMGSCGTGANQMSVPRGIAVDGTTAYVAETGSNRISRWDTVAAKATTHKPTCGGSGLLHPWGITWDPSHTWLYIGDAGRARVVRWNPSTNACEVVTTGADTPEGRLKAPDYLEFGPDGRLYVSDNNRRVYAFTVAG